MSCVSTRNWGRSSRICWRQRGFSEPGKNGENDKAVALVPLNRREAQPRVLEGRLRDLPPAEYAIELVMPDYSDKLTAKAGPPGKPDAGKPMRAAFAIRPPDSKEMIDLENALAAAGGNRGQERRQGFHAGKCRRIG